MLPVQAPDVLLHLTLATLFPKLRVYFAEFLNENYLARLSMLYSSTCVGFSTVSKCSP